MSDERDQFGKRLGNFLIEQNITRRQAAESVNCTGATIGRWMRGEVPYCVLILAELRRKYQIDLNELICGDENANSNKM